MVIVLLASGFEELEALTPIDILRRNDIDVKTVSITSESRVTGAHGIQVVADMTVTDVTLSDIRMLILPGGVPGAENLSASMLTHKFIDAALENGAHIAAISNAQAILEEHGVLSGVQATCHPSVKDKIPSARFVNADVVTDGIFTTAKSHRSAVSFADELVDICKALGIVKKADLAEDPTPTAEQTDASLDEDEPFTDEDDIFIDELLGLISGELDEHDEEEETGETEKPDKTDYIFPPIELLTPAVPRNSNGDEREAIDTKNAILAMLKRNGAPCTVSGIVRGPRISRYELTPNPGVSVSRIMNATDGIELELSKEGVRVAGPIPGKAAIGVEVPNDTPDIVHISELIRDEDFLSSTSKSYAAIGKDACSEAVFCDISKMPHALICGATGTGKSVLINSILISLLYKARPDEVKLMLIDPKRVEFRAYKDIPHLITPIIYDPKRVSGALTWAVDEMERRYDRLAAASVRNIDAFNEKVKADPSVGETMPRIVIVIDELADLMMQQRDPIEALIMRLTQKARAVGIHLIIATQSPRPDVVTSLIRINIPMRITLKLVTATDSRYILGTLGAEKLLLRGDMLYLPMGDASPRRVQGAYVSDAEVEKVTSFIRSNNPHPCYDESLNSEIDRHLSSSHSDIDDGAPKTQNGMAGYISDSVFLEAVELVISEGKVTTSFLQRKLSVSFSRALELLSIMENMGVVSSKDESDAPRRVLISLDEWQERLEKIRKYLSE